MFEQLKKIISKQLKIDEDKITPDTNLRRDFGVNSIELAELVLELEQEYDCEIDEKELSKLSTVGEIADYLTKAANRKLRKTKREEA